MLSSIPITAFNHLLTGEPWACKRLQSYAGKSVHLSIFPLIDLNFIIQTDGKIAYHHLVDTISDATLVIAPNQLPRLISHDESAFHEIKTMGDTLLANELLFIVKNLHWDIEQDLSAVFGDVLAHRVIQTGQNFIRWQSGNLFNLSQAVVEYLSEESTSLSNHTQIDRFAKEVSSLSEQVACLEKRINRLTGH
jgi:ubiquinone biosynthesis accessory factor UbiJ